MDRYYLTRQNNSLLYHLQMCERMIHHWIILQCVPLGQAKAIGSLPYAFNNSSLLMRSVQFLETKATLPLCSSTTPWKLSYLHYYTQNYIEIVWCQLWQLPVSHCESPSFIAMEVDVGFVKNKVQLGQVCL